MKKSLFFLLIAVWIITACKKDDDTSFSNLNNATLRVLLTDNPADADAVNIEIIGLSVQIAPSDTDTATQGSWHALNVNTGKSVVQTGKGEYLLKPVIKKDSFTER